MKRNYGIDLCRIFSMLMIITLHYLGHGGFLNNSQGIYKIISYSIEALALCSVNVYIIISGYYLSSKKGFKLKKLIDYYLQLVIIDFTISLFLYFSGIHKFSLTDVVISLLPFTTKSNWFISCYLVLYILHPYINKLINNLNNKEYKILLFILVLFFSIFQTLVPNLNWTLDSTRGYGIIWFIILYIIGAYIKINDSNKVFNFKKKTYFILYMLFSAIICIQCVLLSKLNPMIGNIYNLSNVYSYNNIFVLISAISLFLFFKKAEIKNEKIIKIININTPLILGISIIHTQRFLKVDLWTKILNVDIYYNSIMMIPILILDVIVVYFICSIIEYFRIRIMKKIKISNWLENKIMKIIAEYINR